MPTDAPTASPTRAPTTSPAPVIKDCSELDPEIDPVVLVGEGVLFNEPYFPLAGIGSYSNGEYRIDVPDSGVIYFQRSVPDTTHPFELCRSDTSGEGNPLPGCPEGDSIEPVLSDTTECAVVDVNTLTDGLFFVCEVHASMFGEFVLIPPETTTTTTTTAPDTITYSTSFEDATFPNEPGWSTYNWNYGESRRDAVERRELHPTNSSDWELTDERAYQGTYSIFSPDFSNATSTRVATVELSTVDTGVEWKTPGTLTFYLETKNFNSSGIYWYLDINLDEEQGFVEDDTDWTRYDVYLPAGEHIIIWDFIHFSELDNEEGLAYIDQVYFTSDNEPAPAGGGRFVVP